MRDDAAVASTSARPVRLLGAGLDQPGMADAFAFFDSG
jgi:hypothetical protein